MAAAFLVFGCTKTPETPPSNIAVSTISKNQAKGIKKCAITKIATHDPNSAYVDEIATFTYTDKGLPHTITFNHEPSTAYPEYEFVYDKNHKLTELLAVYDGRSNYEAWTIYQYGKKGLIAFDTTYIWGGLQPGMTHPRQSNNYLIIVHTYTYDNQRRITRVSQRTLPNEYDPEGSATTYTYYNYNEAGNLGNNYSEAVNINQTSEVFQFVNRDYSINSPIAPAEVNARNLPTSYKAPQDVYAANILRIYLSNSEIVYSCDAESIK